MTATPFGDLPRLWAGRRPADEVAVAYSQDQLTWNQLEQRASRRARLFLSLGVRADDHVVIALPNGVLFHEVSFAVWKCGATPTIVSAKLPEHEFAAIVDLVKPALVVGGPPGLAAGSIPRLEGDADVALESDAPFASGVAAYWKAMTSGGSTGRPKVIVDRKRAEVAEGEWAAAVSMGMEPGMVILNPGPLYHNAPFLMTHSALFTGCRVIGMVRFDPEEALQLIERHRVNWVTLVPTMMHRIWSLPAEVRDRYDLSSLKIVWHMAAPCPAWLKAAWVDWLGGERIYELYGGTEGIGGTVIRGDEWMAKRGSVGRPVLPELLKVVREDGARCEPGEIGEIYFNVPDPAAAPYHYIGAEAKSDPGGWQSLGDLGHLDEDGYLFLADRRTDLILRGGANIYPAEIEAALDEHPAVGSSVALGLPCEELGQRVHAIVQPAEGQSLDLAEVHAFLSTRLAKYKLPESYELASEPLRDDAGKVRRSALRDDRMARLAASDDFRIKP